MSDGFDKEAEREKLREKLADDEEKREHTQRMSELLLQGATMTNRHCDDCGDPIFRKDGQEFCPTCHTVDAADEGSADPTAGTSTSAASGDVGADAVDRSPTPPTDGAPSPATGANGSAEPRRPDRESTGTPSEPSTGTPSEPSTGTTPEPSTGVPDPTAGAFESPPTTTAGSESVADARASLTRTLHRFAVAAEETDDPRRARDHLRAAREAAEALSALDR
ncbi:Sjogren's syndrome/scleroderma autoantigen 1 family protein [Halorubrum sp. Ea8]|uniref:Sjogren's syndrome/scleroderma autoantigen 1 family protein n=1 Tax=Halorubrum sp. Ea8 TaxID=1383841 RepID=UPI000B998FFD|nr:Sjogren's syndrome/scleroderma autoantigen 1 family protein [Halorubrum sp. Ea8]OYR51854.1 hypothetical protein DJ74_02985 [Halorubrum sp. Ea8]